IIVSSHNLDEIDRLTNTIYFMKDGALLKESLTDIASKKYFLTVSDVEKAKQGLTDKSIPFSETGQYQLGFEETDIDLQSFIDSISASGATILDIEVQKVGAEKRYRELFEEELSS